jgi:Zn-finger nucleic acid-binding protein
MICSNCKYDMMVVEYNKVELDYCVNCQGIWFDKGELELFLSSLGLINPQKYLTGILSHPEVKSSEKKRKCPMCNTRMKKSTTGDDSEIFIDVCSRGDGLWFDGGEITSLVKQISDAESPGQNSYRQIVAFLGEVFKWQK